MKVIGVIGAGRCDEVVYEQARDVGRRIASAGYAVLCGGLGGVMEAACRGASKNGGFTIGVLPGGDVSSANPYVELPIATGMGFARNVIIVQSSPVLIAVSGGPGTLSEIAYAMQFNVPVVSLGSHNVSSQVEQVATPEQAVTRALELI